jgi:flagellar protein FlgJ
MIMSDFGSPLMIDPALQIGSATPPSKVSPRDAAGIAKVAEDFEAFFAGLVFDEISSDIEPDPVTGGGEGEAMFKSLLNQEFGKSVARTHGLGIADIVQRQLLQLQEVQ